MHARKPLPAVSLSAMTGQAAEPATRSPDAPNDMCEATRCACY